MRARTLLVLGILAAVTARVVSRLRGQGRAGPAAAPSDVTAGRRIVGGRQGTEGATGVTAASAGTLRGVSEIRRFFRTSGENVYFVSATAFNLLGIDRWVRNFRYVNYYDSFEGHHPNVFVPHQLSPPLFESIEEICNYLLGHKEVVDEIQRNGPGGKAVFLMFDEETERLAAEAGLEVAFPPAALRHRLDSKLETTRLADEAGVASVPNVIGRAGSYDELLALAAGAGIGDDLVVQTAYGDSGKTTFFVSSRETWDENAAELVGAELKAMKRIDCREAAIEGVITRHGTLVGPLMTELTGFPELTPYGGGWCGNDVFGTVLTERHRTLAREFTQRMGDRLRAEGYRGYFELDVLADMGSGELYLGELNPRVTGASSMTNVTAVAYGDMPLFLFHLLEFMGVDFDIDVAALNDGWARPGAVDDWSQFILKETDDVTEHIVHAPRSGVWTLDPRAPGGARFVRRETDWHTVSSEDEAFYLRVASEGQIRYPGADLGILVTRGRLMNDDHELTDRAHAWINGVKAQFSGAPVPPEAPVPAPGPFSFKML
jgi:biotin carboxylase